MRFEPGSSMEEPPTRTTASGRVSNLSTMPSAAVNGWRGPGAIAIALAHLGTATDALPVRYVWPVALLVDLFFVLSGFVIAQAYSTKLSKASNIPEYVIRRFGRIWPVQAVTLAILVGYETLKALLEASGHGHFSSPGFSRDGLSLVEAIPTNLLLVQSLGLHDRETWNFPSWSLSVEFATYVAFALFCLMAPIWRRALSVATIVASVAILVLVAPYGMRSTFDYGIFRCLAGFFAGTLCYEVAARWPMPRVRYPTLLELAALALVVVWLGFAVETWAGYAAPAVFGLFVFVFLGEGGRLSRLLRTRVLQVLANLSFSIYMVHALVLTALLAFFHALAKGRGLALFKSVPNPFAGHAGTHPNIEVLHVGSLGQAALILFLYLTGIAAAAVAAYRIVEVPGRGLFNRLAKRLSKLASRGRLRATAMGSMERAP